MTSKPMAAPLKAFLLALGTAALIFLPFIILDKGYFIYYGDFNVQQIPFYQLAHQAVRSGDVLWSWYTDLGANFIGSYSFYLLFSPFFWLTLPFPTAFVPYLMGPLLILKTACAAAAASLYLSRFARDRDYAVLGGLLYAFSGWMLYNVFFNHFHDVAVFFPLLLYSVELLVSENRKGLFAAMVAVCAMVNYWFFVGEVVFVILYVIVRSTDRHWGMTLGRFVHLALESVLGVCLAAAVLLPSVLALMGNPRTGTGELLTGWNFWLYWHEQYYLAIPQSLFFPPDLPAWPNFFQDKGARWASLSGWLPLLGMSGVLAYFFQRRGDWLKKILAICMLFAMVPGFNSLFILLNHSYYARWFFMPILLMALVTARALEDSREDQSHFSRALKWCMGITIAYVVICGVTPSFQDGELRFGLAADPDKMWITSIAAMLCVMLTTLLVVRLRTHRRFKALAMSAVMLVSVVFGIYYLSGGKANSERSSFVINKAIGGREIISLPDDGFARSDMYNGQDNTLMFWHLPNIQAFHSIVPTSIMEFYPLVGVTRDVGSRPEADFYALRPLLSVRWLFIDEEEAQQYPMPGYSYWGTQLGFNIYENDHYLPMGFGYTHYLLREEMEEVATELRSNLMLRVVILEDEDAAARNRDLLTHLNLDVLTALDQEGMYRDVDMRWRSTCYDFAIDCTGFTARANLEEDTLLFFSVPHEAGWSATVNGEEALIEKVNVGFMAVRVPAGESVIRFDYFTPGLKTGALASGGALVILLVYLLIARLRRKTQGGKSEMDLQRALFAGETVSMSWEEYLRRYHQRQQRARELQRALNEAAARHIGETLAPEEKTLPFGESCGETAVPEEEAGSLNGTPGPEDAVPPLGELPARENNKDIQADFPEEPPRHSGDGDGQE